MHFEISNKIKIKDCNNWAWEWIFDNLVVDNPTYITLDRLGKEDTIKWKHVPPKLNCYSKRGNDAYVPFGCLNALWPIIKQCSYTLNFNSNPDISLKNKKCPVELYDYQQEAVDYMVKAKGGVLVSPCGSGKTFMGIEIIRRLGKRFLWLTHTKDLLNQTMKEFKGLYEDLDIGTITEGKIDMGKDGTISTIQTLSKIDAKIYSDYFDVVVVDECAHCAGSVTNRKMFQDVVEQIPARYKYGLTATPARSDSLIKTMYMILGTSKAGLFEPTFKIEKERVKTIVAEHVRYDLETVIPYDSEIRQIDGTIEYVDLINFLAENNERNNEICKNVFECSKEKRKQIVLCSRVDQCYVLGEKLKALGLKVDVVTGKVTKKARSISLAEDNNWDVLVATYSLLKEGISIKKADTLHLTAPIKDKSTIVQCVGRIERFLENKKRPIVYDYVDKNISYCLKKFTERKRYIKKRF